MASKEGGVAPRDTLPQRKGHWIRGAGVEYYFASRKGKVKLSALHPLGPRTTHVRGAQN